MNKQEIQQELVVRIEKLSNQGLGIAKVDGFVIFVENSCPGDVVKIKIVKKNKNFANAKILEIVEPSKYRVEPFCKMHKVCGACQLQFIDYSFQLKFKKEIVGDAMYSIFGELLEVKDVIPSPQNKEYRHKIQYPISQTRDSKRILAGYYQAASHELINIKHCPIQPEYCDKIIDFIRENTPLCGVSGYVEKTHRGELRHVVIRASAYNSKNLVILVVNSDKLSAGIKKLAEKIYNDLKNVSGVGVNFNNKKTNLILGDETEILFGEDYIEEKLCDKIFKVGAKTFFQVNPKSADNIFNYVKDYIEKNYTSPSILDAYAGISTFGICLSDKASSVTTVEEVPESVALANRIIKENNINNVETKCMDSELFFKECIDAGKVFDIVVLDPPRKGCTQASLDYAIKLARKTIVYVSCNPATLARDLKYLREKGAKIGYIQPFDMFPHTYHIEDVVFIDV